MKTNTAIKKYAIGLAFTCGILMSSSLASAATVNCPGTAASTDREFTLTTTTASVCLASGAGNINGNADSINALGYVTLDKSDDNTTGLFPLALTIVGSGTLSGSFSFVAPTGFTNFVLGFKSGVAQLNPDWVAFGLAAGVSSGTWAIIAGSQSLSHVNLYGQRCTANCAPPVGEVPLPAAFPLLLGALGGLTWLSRSRKRKHQA